MKLSIDTKSYEKAQKNIARYIQDSYMESITASNLGLMFTLNSGWTEQQRYALVFNILKKTTEALYKVALCYGRLVLAYSGIDWEEETKGHEQKIIGIAEKVLGTRKELVYGLDLNLLRENLETIRILRNFFSHYEDETRRIRNFVFSTKETNEFSYQDVVLNFREINKTKPSKSFERTISCWEFLKMHFQFYIAYVLLEGNYALFHVKSTT